MTYGGRKLTPVSDGHVAAIRRIGKRTITDIIGSPAMYEAVWKRRSAIYGTWHRVTSSAGASAMRATYVYSFELSRSKSENFRVGLAGLRALPAGRAIHAGAGARRRSLIAPRAAR